MPKMRVHEVAKMFSKSSKEVIAALKQQGIDVQSHMSTVTEENVEKIRPFFGAGTAKKAQPKPKDAPQPKQPAQPKKQEQNTHQTPAGPQGQNGEQALNRQKDQTQSVRQEEKSTKPGDQPKRREDNRSRDGRERRNDTRREPGRENRGEGGRRNNDNRSFGGRRDENGRGGTMNRGGENGRRNNDNRSFGGRRDENGRGTGHNSEGTRGGENRRLNNRNGEGGRNYNGRNADNNRGAGRNGEGGRNYNNRGGENRDTRGGNTQRGNDGRRNRKSSSILGGDTPINTKESRNANNNRHEINREHSRENNRNGEGRDARGGKNSRRNNNNNRNNNFGTMSKKPKNKTKQPVVQPPKKEEPKEEVIRNITLPNPVSLKELAEACKITPAVIIKKLFLSGKMVTINTEFPFDEAADIALEYNCIAEEEVQVDVIEELLKEDEEDESKMTGRPPVVCVMGHVDHGKTSLLDRIRSSHVTAGEAGGITQHIGAYVVNINGEKITFLDTPGHEAFTSMRLRGAQATDIAVLVVAADDGVMPQTVEAINHAKAAGVEVIVAVNKIDKEGANVDRVKQELTEYGLIAEDWGGSTVFVPVSAKTGEGIDDLLEMITLTAEVLELKANPKRQARGLVIEAKLDKGRGPVATILIQKGTLHVGDTINIGHAYGRVRAMLDDQGNRVKAAGPSVPVEILGLNDVPFSGEVMMAHGNEKEARATADAFIAYSREKMLEETKSKLSLDDLFDQIQAGNVKELNLVVKADVQGSVEAVKQSLVKLSNEEVMIKVIHGAVGAINESDVTLASASNAIIIGFNVRPDAMAKSVAEREKVDMRLYRVIYNAIEDIEAAIKGMLDPVYQEKVVGHLDVRQIYKASGVGTIAGCYVVDGMIARSSQVRIVRDGIVIYEGTLASLKRFKDDVKEVKSGFECGLVFEKYNDVKEGDQVEAFMMEEIPR